MLTDGVDQNPHCVLLLDEIEKAHFDLFNILLQVMDYGKLTDHNGKSVDFRNVILIMTSNAGAIDLSKKRIGFNSARSKDDANATIPYLEQLPYVGFKPTVPVNDAGCLIDPPVSVPIVAGVNFAAFYIVRVYGGF